MSLEKRILVVDDDDTIRALLRTVLRRRGFRVDSARNGVEAMELMTRCRYSLVVLDLMMPLMSGYEMLDQLQDPAIRGSSRVLILTAGLEPRVMSADFIIGTIHKPFDIELFVDAVTGYVGAVEGLAQLDDCATPADSNDSTSIPN